MSLDQVCHFPSQISTKEGHMNEARKRWNQGEGDRKEVRKEGGRHYMDERTRGPS